LPRQVKQVISHHDIAAIISYKHRQCTQTFVNATLKKSFVYFFRDAIFLPFFIVVLHKDALWLWGGGWGRTMRLCQPPDVSTSPKYKLLCFITTKKILQREERTSF
jgi:hypothetical protein